MAPTELSPALAEKALLADQRNTVRRVGEGKPLSGPQRQMLIGLMAGDARPEELRQARVNALLRKWLDGGRLSREERDEIADVLPDATYIIGEAPAVGESSNTVPSEKDILERYQISRATYFRWKSHGASVAEGADPPPWDAPGALVAWYERMKGRGVFKQRCPRSLIDAARTPQAASPVATAAPPPADEKPASSQAVTSSRAAPAKQGFLAELEALQQHTASLREAYLAAETAGEQDTAKVKKAEYFGLLETLRKYEKDKEQIATASGELVRKTDVQRDLDERLPSIVANLEYMIDRVDPQLQSAPDRSTRRKIWRAALSECFKSLRGSKYAPPLELLST